MGMKLGMAFLFQEQTIKAVTSYVKKPLVNELGALFLPSWNKIANHISGVPQTDDYVNQSLDLYPGDDHCRGYSPHALWHEEAADGLLELTFLCDYGNKILTKNQDNA